MGEYKSGDEMCERKKKIYARRVARWHTPPTCATIEFALRGSCGVCAVVRIVPRRVRDCEREVCVAHAASDSHFLSQPMPDFYVFTSHKYVTWSADSEAFVRRQQSTVTHQRDLE